MLCWGASVFAWAHRHREGCTGVPVCSAASRSPLYAWDSVCQEGEFCLQACLSVCLSVCRPPELMAYPRILANPLANTWDATKAALEQLGSRGGVDITK